MPNNIKRITRKGILPLCELTAFFKQDLFYTKRVKNNKYKYNVIHYKTENIYK